MFKIDIHKLDTPVDKLTRVVCVTRYKDKWVFCKHKERDTYEIPGGHIEEGEDPLTAVKREMYEETGATTLTVIEPVAIYSISTYGMLYYVEIESMEEVPDYEMEKIILTDTLPSSLTYPDAHTTLYNTVLDYLKTREE